MAQLRAMSQLTGDVLDLGIPTDDVDAILGLGEIMATNRDDSLIVFVDETPGLPEWRGDA